MRTCKIIDVTRRYEQTKLVSSIEIQFNDGSKQIVNGVELFTMINKDEVRVVNIDYVEFYGELFENKPKDIVLDDEDSKESAINELAKLTMLGVAPEVNARGWITGVITQNLIINKACNETYLSKIEVEGDITFKCSEFYYKGIKDRNRFTIKASKIIVMNPDFARNMLAKDEIELYPSTVSEVCDKFKFCIDCSILVLGYTFTKSDHLYYLRKILDRLYHDGVRLKTAILLLDSGIIKMSAEDLVKYIGIAIKSKKYIDYAENNSCEIDVEHYSFTVYYRSTMMEDVFVDLMLLQVIYQTLNSDHSKDWWYAQTKILEMVHKIEEKFHNMFKQMIKYTKEKPTVDIASHETSLYNGGIINFAKSLNSTFNNCIFRDMEI